MTQTTDREKSLADRITEVVQADEVQLPPLPEVAIKLQDLLASDRADAGRVTQLITNEPAVTTALLRIANSAAFGGLQPVTDLKQAIARLGLKHVGNLVTTIAVKGHFATDSEEKREMLKCLWDHSVATAFAARAIAARTGVDDAEAFLGGLLHDSGRLLVLKAVDHLQQNGLEFEPTPVVLRELMDLLHTELGFHALSGWNLPEPIPRVVRHHEDPADNSEDRLLLSVQAANLITRKLGFHPDPDPEIELMQEPAIERIGMGDVELAALMVDLEDQLEEVRRLL